MNINLPNNSRDLARIMQGINTRTQWGEFMKDAREAPDIPTMMKKWDHLVNWKRVPRPNSSIKNPYYPKHAQLGEEGERISSIEGNRIFHEVNLGLPAPKKERKEKAGYRQVMQADIEAIKRDAERHGITDYVIDTDSE